MKKLIITSVIFYAACSIIVSQVNFDLRIGLSPGSNSRSVGIIVNRNNPLEEFEFNLIHVRPQFYGGVSAHLQLRAPFFLESGITYTKRTSLYQCTYQIAQFEFSVKEIPMSESEEMILMPLNIGVGLGPIDVTSGLTFIKTISTINELSHLNGFGSDPNSLKWGWQMGIRYAFRRVMAGIEYQATMNRVCDGMYVNGKSIELMNVPGRFVFNLQYRFWKL